MDMEKMLESVNDKDIKDHLSAEFKIIKEKYLQQKEKQKLDIYEEVKKMMYDSRRETSEVVQVNLQEFETQCNNDTRIQRIKVVNKKLKFMEGEPLVISSLKGYLLFQHKKAIGTKDFIQFLADTGENYDYCTFLIKFYKLLQKYKNLQNCKLPVRFFKAKFAVVKEVCMDNAKDWEN